MAKALALLTIYHLLFFWKAYTKPFSLATSELLSTFFPTWIWQGKQWSKWRVPKYENNYWLLPNAHPVTSTYYPLGIISSFIFSKKNLDLAFLTFTYFNLLHFLGASIGWFIFLSWSFHPLIALFGAITFTYQAYPLKQQPCIIYTLAWFPWIAICPALAIGMILLAGYYPLAIYLLPAGLILNHDPLAWCLGFLIGSVQLVPFLRYLPKTIRKQSSELSCPPWEKNFYIGLTPIILLALNFQWRFLWIFTPMILSYVLRRHLPRIYQRAWILSAYLAIYFVIQVLGSVPQTVLFLLLIVQCFDLWIHNSALLPTRPYCELYQKPSLAFKSTSLVKFLESHLGDNRVSGLPFPLFTGLINNFRTLGYSGGMQLKLMAKWRNDKDPNGSGEHDYFRSNNDNDALTRYRVKFAYSRKGISGWMQTRIKHLYRNPAL